MLRLYSSRFRWADAADRANARVHTSTSLPREHKRKEPLGQANNSISPIPSDQRYFLNKKTQ